MRGVIVLVGFLLSVPAGAQTVMYIRPPRAVLCNRLDLAKIAVQVAYEANRAGRAARPYPRGCWVVKPPMAVTLLDEFDQIAYVGLDVGAAPQGTARAWVHVGALSETPEREPRRRPR